MKIDAFLSLYDPSGNLVEGESSDEAFPRHIELLDFGYGDGSVKEDGGATAEKAGDAEAKMAKVVEALNKLKDERTPDAPKLAQSALKDANEVVGLIRKLKEDLAAGEKEKPPENPEPEPAAGKKAGGGLNKLTFNVSKDIDSASPDLFQAYCRRKAHTDLDVSHPDFDLDRFRKAVVTVRKMFAEDPHPYLTCTFTEVRIENYQLKYDSGRSLMGEEVTFSFVGFQVQYKAQTYEGTEGRVYIADGTVGGRAGR